MDYTLIKIKEKVLEDRVDFEPFKMTSEPALIKKGDQVIILQHSLGKELSFSTHRCSDKVGKFPVVVMMSTEQWYCQRCLHECCTLNILWHYIRITDIVLA